MDLRDLAAQARTEALAQLQLAQQFTSFVEVLARDRTEMARALVLQGYSPERAFDLAVNLPPNDGALQMLARHRINAGNGPKV